MKKSDINKRKRRRKIIMQVYKQVENEKGVLKIVYDTDAPNPREINENLGTMICYHRKYRLGDETFNPDNYNGWNEVLKGECGYPNEIIYLPLYLYDHSGITISTKPFPCAWDSGQVGWIYVTKERIRKEYGVKLVTKNIKEKVLSILENEVKIYDHYLTGEVFGYIIEDHEGNEIDSCYGFYGDDFVANGLFDAIPNEYKSLVEKMIISENVSV
jgi:hypothetical protein